MSSLHRRYKSTLSSQRNDAYQLLFTMAPVTLLAANVEDAISHHHIPLYCPCPEARIWPLDIPGRAVKQGDSPNLSQNSLSPGGTVCESWGEPQEIQLLSAGVYKKDGVFMLLPIVGNVA